MTLKRGSCARMLLRVVLLLVGGSSLAAAPDGALLPLDEAIELGLARSYRIASQRAAVGAANEMSARAGALPDPKLRFGIDNLPITDSDRFRYDRESMTMRRIGVMQEFPNAGKRDATRRGAAACPQRGGRGACGAGPRASATASRGWHRVGGPCAGRGHPITTERAPGTTALRG